MTLSMVIKKKDGNYSTEPPTEPGLEAVVAPAVYDVLLSSSGCNFVADTTDVLIGTITCSFVTEGALGYTAISSLYTADCSSPLSSGDVSIDTTATGFVAVRGSGVQYSSPYTVSFPIANRAALADYQIAFCVKTSVMDDNLMVYDFTGQKIRLNINLNEDFTSASDLTTELFNGIAVAEQEQSVSYTVGIKRCDADGNAVGDDTVLAVGETFFLCVEGSEDRVVVNNISYLTAEGQANGASLPIIAVDGSGGLEGTLISNTFVYGYGENQVIIATRLPVAFFVSAQTVVFSGVANIYVDSVDPGRVLNSQLSRGMQVASEESASFSMDIQVVGMDDASSASAIKTTAAMFFVAAVAALIV